MAKVYDSILDLVGKTPLVELKRIEEKEGLQAKLIAKVESFNPAGSVKDHIAKAMIEDAEAKGLLKEGSVIIEPTSGNTGIGLAAAATVKGYRMILTMPETMSVERRNIVKAYGAEVVLTDGTKGMKGAIEKADELAKEIPNSFIAGQFVNPANPATHKKTTGPELKESYFDDDAIVLLESMQDGVIYSNILLKLYLKSLKNGGKLQLDENIPYTAQMIATITRQQVGTVERALKIFMKLGLVEPLPSGALYMSNIELLIGQSSTEGERKRRARLALQEQKALPQTGADKCPPYRADICPPEIEIEKEIDIEIEKERELETGHPAPAAYGRYHNVILSDTELDGLKTELPGKWEYYIDRLSCHIASSGRKYKSHAATIFKWAQEDAAKKAPKKGIPDYTCKEGESL